MHIDELWVVVLDDFGEETSIAEISRDVFLRPREGETIDPFVYVHELVFGTFHI